MAQSLNSHPLAGKVALVTGASRGIGAAAAIRLAQGGAAVAVNYYQNQDAARKIAEQIAADGGRSMAIELGPLGISVNVVTPAFTLTDASMIMPEAFRERVKETRPLKKHLYPEDVAGAIAFLAGDEASMLTGSHILITGGSHLQL